MPRKPNTTEIAKLYLKGEMTQEEIGKIYGIGKKAVNNRLVSVGVKRRAPKYQRIKKAELERLYSEERLPIKQIRIRLGCAHSVLQQALEFYGIPERTPVKKRGKYDYLLENLKIGETTKITLEIDYPHIILHKTAKALGIRISVRFTGDGFKVTRRA